MSWKMKVRKVGFRGLFLSDNVGDDDFCVADRTETSSQHSHSPANMYHQTLPLLDFVLKMRPRAEQEDNTFKQITISWYETL